MQSRAISSSSRSSAHACLFFLPSHPGVSPSITPQPCSPSDSRSPLLPSCAGDTLPNPADAKMAVDNAGAMGWSLSPQDLDALEAAADSLGFEFAAGFKLE